MYIETARFEFKVRRAIYQYQWFHAPARDQKLLLSMNLWRIIAADLVDNKSVLEICQPRACLYGAGLARVPGLASFAKISPPQRIPQHY